MQLVFRGRHRERPRLLDKRGISREYGYAAREILPPAGENAGVRDDPALRNTPSLSSESLLDGLRFLFVGRE